MAEFHNIPVRDIMETNVRTVDAGGLLREAARIMRDADITCLVIDLADPARGMGILTQKDVIGHLFDGFIDFDSSTVEEVMTHPTLALTPEMNLETAVSLMRMMGIRRAPVVESGKLVGLISFTDVFRASFK